ncbi:hypothetical protein Tco_0163919 [Tanacetum coccineum]
MSRLITESQCCGKDNVLPMLVEMLSDYDFWKISFHRGRGKLQRQVLEQEERRLISTFKDKMQLMEARGKRGVTLDAEVEAFLANVDYCGLRPQCASLHSLANLLIHSGNNHLVHELELERRAKVVPISLENQNLTAELAKRDICSIVLYSDVAVTTSSNCLCEELRSNCDREHSKVVELEAEILKKQQMLNESEKRCAFIEKNHVNLQVKFQKYKECLQNQRVCDNTNSTASNAIFEINKLKDQLQGKDDTIRNLQTQINITRMLNVGSM